MKDDVLFSIENIYVKYDKKYILKDFNLQIKRNEFFVVLGANGCGKSTLIKSLVRVNKINYGIIKYENQCIDLKYPITLKKQINFNKLKLAIKNRKLDKLINLNKNNVDKETQKNKINKLEEEIRIIQHHLELDKQLLKDWKSLKHFHSKKLALKVSYVPQLQEFPEQTTVYDFVKLGRYPHSNALGLNFDYLKEHEIIIDALNKVGIEPIHNKFLNELSGGQKQKALIALALAQSTDTIILDEPTNHLDVKAQLEIIELLNKLHKEMNKNIIMIIHDINMGAKHADRILLMKDGNQIALGNKFDVITKENILEAFGVDAEIIKDENGNLKISEFWLNNDNENK